MNLQETHKKEVAKWDSLTAQKTDESLLLKPSDDFEKYSARTSTMVGVTEYLGDLKGKRVLEFGCGLGEISALLAKSGAEVTTFDLSGNSVFTARRRAVLNGVEEDIALVVAAGEALPFTDECFDVLFGKAILHHLDVNLGSEQLYRVLKAGGKAVFVEPMGMNPVLNFVREYVPYPNKNPRGEDHPLNYQEITILGRDFRKYNFREIQLLSMLERGLGFGKRIKILRHLEDFLLDRFPFLRRYCRYVVMYMEK
jgi:ubiquinone/menaquinone biosynthesis C-methylase UbiE